MQRHLEELSVLQMLTDSLNPRKAELRLPLRSLGLGPWQIEQAQIVRRKVGRRCLIEYRLKGPEHATTILGKMRERSVDCRAYEAQRYLWENGFGQRASAQIIVAEPVGIVPEWNLWLQRKIPGRSLTELLTANTLPDPICAARAIAKLHRTPVPHLRAFGIQDELKVLRVRLPKLAVRRPDWIDRIKNLMVSIEAAASQVSKVRPRTIHRDFYPDHLIFGTSTVGIIDLDLLCQGDPAIDIGNFLAHLTEWALRTRGDPEAVTSWQHNFEEAYQAVAGKTPNIRLYEWLSLVRLIQIAAFMPEREPSSGSLFDWCEERLRKST